MPGLTGLTGLCGLPGLTGRRRFQPPREVAASLAASVVAVAVDFAHGGGGVFDGVAEERLVAVGPHPVLYEEFVGRRHRVACRRHCLLGRRRTGPRHVFEDVEPVLDGHVAVGLEVRARRAPVGHGELSQPRPTLAHTLHVPHVLASSRAARVQGRKREDSTADIASDDASALVVVGRPLAVAVAGDPGKARRDGQRAGERRERHDRAGVGVAQSGGERQRPARARVRLCRVAVCRGKVGFGVERRNAVVPGVQSTLGLSRGENLHRRQRRRAAVRPSGGGRRRVRR
mmetsp:Transcript_23643/g.80783  ORF Transcript_23643/g.80783 Transcript_23643/m.80783 type:complete len:287 (-) Transcript_23643:383-1243(-)